ncbi:MAG: threonine synthase [Sphingomonadales bacterium]|nr:threonine synthase [Sphingomonadales bacterium]
MTQDNRTAEIANFVTHLECSKTGDILPAGTVQNLSPTGAPILVRYDLAAVAETLTKEKLAARPTDLWRYRELLPVVSAANIVSLGEDMTPLITLDNSLGSNVIVKDEGRLPTGSFKARGLVMAVSMAKELGLKRLAMPTNGNAGAAMAAYARRAGMEAFVFCPDDTPEVNVREIALQGGKIWRVNGLINDCGKIVADGEAEMGWFNLSTLKEPYRIEGKKTMGLELAEQFGWSLPDVIFYPTGGGTGLIGMWKAFAELKAIGWLQGPMPRMVAVQAEGCAPIVKAWEAGEEHAPLWPDAHTVAAGIRVPVAVGDFLIIRAVRESGGFCMAVDDDAIIATRDAVAREDGLLLCPEGAATVEAYRRALAQGLVGAEEKVVLFNCATGLKYPMAPVTRTIARGQAPDYAAMT